MGSASKKTTPRRPASTKPRYSQAEASMRMMTATTHLLIEFPPAEVTVHRICEKAGVHTDYVARYFGSREELLCQSIEGAFLSVILSLGVSLNNEADETSRLQVVLDYQVDAMQMARARIRTIAYLLGCGISPERFQSSQKMAIESVVAKPLNQNVMDRTRINLALIGLLLMQAMGVFAEVNDMSEQQQQDIYAYIGYMSQSGETVQSALNWDTPKTKARAKGTTKAKSTK
jgi:AcrR family transcriptional regulator